MDQWHRRRPDGRHHNSCSASFASDGATVGFSAVLRRPTEKRILCSTASVARASADLRLPTETQRRFTKAAMRVPRLRGYSLGCLILAGPLQPRSSWRFSPGADVAQATRSKVAGSC
ncbi:hypothetical protein MTO96_001815 [Rhipicephalus appendiculatus]